MADQSKPIQKVFEGLAVAGLLGAILDIPAGLIFGVGPVHLCVMGVCLLCEIIGVGGYIAVDLLPPPTHGARN